MESPEVVVQEKPKVRRPEYDRRTPVNPLHAEPQALLAGSSMSAKRCQRGNKKLKTGSVSGVRLGQGNGGDDTDHEAVLESNANVGAASITPRKRRAPAVHGDPFAAENQGLAIVSAVKNIIPQAQNAPLIAEEDSQAHSRGHSTDLISARHFYDPVKDVVGKHSAPPTVHDAPLHEEPENVPHPPPTTYVPPPSIHWTPINAGSLSAAQLSGKTTVRDVQAAAHLAASRCSDGSNSMPSKEAMADAVELRMTNRYVIDVMRLFLVRHAGENATRKRFRKAQLTYKVLDWYLSTWQQDAENSRKLPQAVLDFQRAEALREPYGLKFGASQASNAQTHTQQLQTSDAPSQAPQQQQPFPIESSAQGTHVLQSTASLRQPTTAGVQDRALLQKQHVPNGPSKTAPAQSSYDGRPTQHGPGLQAPVASRSGQPVSCFGPLPNGTREAPYTLSNDEGEFANSPVLTSNPDKPVCVQSEANIVTDQDESFPPKHNDKKQKQSDLQQKNADIEAENTGLKEDNAKGATNEPASNKVHIRTPRQRHTLHIAPSEYNLDWPQTTKIFNNIWNMSLTAKTLKTSIALTIRRVAHRRGRTPLSRRNTPKKKRWIGRL